MSMDFKGRDKIDRDLQMIKYTERLAVYTKSLSKSTIVLAISTTVLVFITGITSVINVYQFKAANQQADIAAKTLLLSQAQFRATVSASINRIATDIFSSSSPTTVSIMNIGQTIASSVRHRMSGSFFDQPFDSYSPPDFILDDGEEDYTIDSDLLPTIPLGIPVPNSGNKSASYASSYANMKSYYITIGKIYYKDLVGLSHHTTFCIIIKSNKSNNTLREACPRYNEMD